MLLFLFAILRAVQLLLPPAAVICLLVYFNLILRSREKEEKFFRNLFFLHFHQSLNNSPDADRPSQPEQSTCARWPG
jgi:hypothetical protein